MHKHIALLTLSMLLPAGFAVAQTPPAGACFAASTSRMDELLNPVKGGDEAFFSQPSGPPNVAFVIDNSCSMIDGWPVDFCTGSDFVRGCNCPQIDAMGYRNDVVYESEINNLNAGSFHTAWFNPKAVYDVRNFRSGSNSYGATVGNAPQGHIASFTGSISAESSYTTACSDTDAPSTCRTCLATKGYFIGDNHRWDSYNRGDWRVTGNFLNHYSPRYLMARRVLKQVIRDIQPVRMMTMTFNYSNGTRGPDVLSEWNPPCNQSDPYKNSSNFYSNRQSIINTLDSSLRFAGNTPLARSLYAAGFAFQQAATSGSANHVYSSAFGSNWRTDMGLTDTQISALQEKGGNNQKAVRALLESYHRIDGAHTDGALWLEAEAARAWMRSTSGDDIATSRASVIERGRTQVR